MKFKGIYWLGIFVALALIGADIFFFFKTRWFLPILIVSFSLGWLQFWIDFFREANRQKDIELKFIDFMRSLVESIKSGVSIPRSIRNVAEKDFGSLNPFLKKLANQIEWGSPTRRALTTFSLDTDNKIIKRSVSIIVEAEQSGGDITDILSSVVDSVVNVKKMREERKASVFSQIVQGYIVFFVFIAVMLILQLWLFPKLGSLSGSIQSGMAGLGGLFQSTGQTYNLNTVFFVLIMIQGFFAGIMIGKFSEGTFKNGLLHSLILMTVAALIVTVVKGTI
jgi:flagellar protein FlaJ